MSPLPVTELNAEQRREVARWIALHQERLPEPVRLFLALHGKYLDADGDLRRRFDASVRELRRALGITPSSERRRSGSPLASLPPEQARPAQTEEERLEQQRDRSLRLEGWHRELKKRHRRQSKRLEKRLAKLQAAAATAPEPVAPLEPQDVNDDTPLESILRSRSPSAREVILQADLSTTNLVNDPELLARFTFKLIGCSAHARRPFALYEHEDPVNCAYMLHLFKGLAIHEQRLDVHGRNRQNVLAVRQSESREDWLEIQELATDMKDKWSKATKLGAAARYILKHYDKLTAYLDDPRLEATNNLRERMLRTEKLIEGSSMFRRTLEGRFALDVVRTVMQTAVAAGVPVHAYLESVLRADAEEVAAHPERYTPRAWATDGANE